MVFILIWFEALVILHRYAKKAELKKFSDKSTARRLKVGHFDVFLPEIMILIDVA